MVRQRILRPKGGGGPQVGDRPIWPRWGCPDPGQPKLLVEPEVPLTAGQSFPQKIDRRFRGPCLGDLITPVRQYGRGQILRRSLPDQPDELRGTTRVLAMVEKGAGPSFS